MTWPAPDLRIDYQNATVSADTHPAAHNDTNVTLNDNYRPELTRVGGVADSTAANFFTESDVAKIKSPSGRPIILDGVDAVVGDVYGNRLFQTLSSGTTQVLATGGTPIDNTVTTAVTCARTGVAVITACGDLRLVDTGAASIETQISTDGGAWLGVAPLAILGSPSGNHRAACGLVYQLSLAAGVSYRFRLLGRDLDATGNAQSEIYTSIQIQIWC